MSVRTDWIDVKCAYETLAHRVSDASVGDYHTDVSEALQSLVAQIVVADKAVLIAEQRYRIDNAEYQRQQAEARLAELKA